MSYCLTGVATSRVQTPLNSWLFQASIRNGWNCLYNCDDHRLLDFKSAVQYMKHFIYHSTFILHGLIRTHKWPASNVSGFVAQLVRASRRQREVTSLNPVEVLTFSGFFITAMIIGYLISNLHLNIWNISYITLHPFFTDSLELANDQLPTSVAS